MSKSKELALDPLDDHVVVEPLEAEDVTPGGIVLPDNAKQKPQHGKVLAVGPGRLQDDGERRAIAVAVGDLVLYTRYAGHDVALEGKEYKVVRESDLLAKLV